jgi:hypothetical protein
MASDLTDFARAQRVAFAANHKPARSIPALGCRHGDAAAFDLDIEPLTAVANAKAQTLQLVRKARVEPQRVIANFQSGLPALD